jgi:hypothetical protein
LGLFSLGTLAAFFDYDVLEGEGVVTALLPSVSLAFASGSPSLISA